MSSYPENLNRYPEMYKYCYAVTLMTVSMKNGDVFRLYILPEDIDKISQQLKNGKPFIHVMGWQGLTVLSPAKSNFIQANVITHLTFCEEKKQGEFYGVWEDTQGQLHIGVTAGE